MSMQSKFTVKHHNITGGYTLKSGQYYPDAFKKERIILHHTAGGTAKSSIDWWNKTSERVGTAYVIDRDGTIYEAFNPKYWAYALGINSAAAERKSIQIELANRGWLSKKGSKFYYEAGGKYYEVTTPVQIYKQPHRGHLYFEAYTDAQISALIFLIDKLNKEFNLGIKGSNIEKFWYNAPSSAKKIISHTTVRKDKSDIHPQPNLIKALYDYVGGTWPVTE